MTLKERTQHIKQTQKPTLLRFLSLTEQNLVSSILKDSARFDGGYPDAERKRGYLFESPMDQTIRCFHISYNKKFLTLTHQNILGSLMALSIERDAIGDIIPEVNVFFVIRELQDEILRSFQSISNVPITLSIIDGHTIQKEQKYSYHKVIIPSMRLDVIVSAITSCGRKEAVERIQNNDVKVNHQVDSKHTRIIDSSSILSIRHYGRFELLDSDGRTRKDKIILNYRKFI